MIAFVFLAVVAGVHSASLDSSCSVGSWSEWTQCESSRHCSRIPPSLVTYPMKATAERDSGREKMEFIMKKKQETRAARAACMAAGTCPEMMMRPVPGPVDCDSETGMAGLHACKNVDQLSFTSFEEMGYGMDQLLPPDRVPEGNDVWGWTDPDNNDEYAIMGFTGGTAFVRVTDPYNPVPVGFIFSSVGRASIWRDIKVIGHYAYIVSEALRHGLQVFDLHHLRGLTSLEYFEPDAVNNDFGNAHNIVANEDTNFLYVVGATYGNYPICKGGLLVIDVSDPLNPTYAGCFGDDGYVHDAQCVIYHGPDMRYQGHEVCFCFNEDSLTLVDVTDKNDMTMIAKTGYLNVAYTHQDSLTLVDVTDKNAMKMIAKTGYINVAYTHQGWVTDNHELILLDDELDEYEQDPDDQFTKTYAWDVRDLTDPSLKYVFQSAERSIDHNQYIIGNFSYQANYESGLRILHINQENYVLTNVGYFDVYPPTTNADFFGSWSVYPYLPSGNILVSSIDYGLFVLRANYDAIYTLAVSGEVPAEQKRTRPVLSAVSGAKCPRISESKMCSAQVLC